MPGINGIGKLDRRITIEEEVVTNNAFNEPAISSWSTVATTWCRVEEIASQGSNNEVFSSDQITARRKLKFTIRFKTGLNEKMRIAYNDRYYGIIAIQNPDRKTSTVLLAYILDET
jgi:SPP1 family predicted phage head-tail adaptor